MQDDATHEKTIPLTCRWAGQRVCVPHRHPYSQTPVLIACSPIFSVASISEEVSFARNPPPPPPTPPSTPLTHAHTHGTHAQGATFTAMHDTDMLFNINVFKDESSGRTTIERISFDATDTRLWVACMTGGVQAEAEPA